MNFKSTRREAQRTKARHTTRTSRAFLHTLDRLAAQRDAERVTRTNRRAERAAKAGV